MLRRPFLVFLGLVGMLVGAAVAFIQSERFAGFAKAVLARHMPAELGVSGDFEGFAIRVFPPALSVNKPSVKVAKRNILDLPEGASVRAERIDLVFRPFQVLTGNIRVHQVKVVRGEVSIAFGKGYFRRKATKKKSLIPSLHWDELLQVRAESIELQDTQVRATVEDWGVSAELLAERLSLSQWYGKGGMGYGLALRLRDVKGELPGWAGFPSRVERVEGEARVNAAGLRVERLMMRVGGVQAELAATVLGDLLQPATLRAEGDLVAEGSFGEAIELARVMGAGLASKTDPPFSGSFSLAAKFSGDLTRISESAKVGGQLTVVDFRKGLWSADRVTAEGSWAAAGGGELELSKLVAMAAERRREGGSKAGYGGQVTIGPVRFRPGGSEPIAVPIELERAHPHWLGAPAVRELYPIDARVSGRIGLTIGRKPWWVRAALGLELVDFQVDNQKLGRARPLKRVLRVPKLRLEGVVNVDPNGLRAEELVLALPTTRFTANGKLDFASGFDLRVAGPVDMADIGQLAENDIRGVGTLSAHLRGPRSRLIIDFEPALRSAEYLGLKFGDIVRGRISLDEDPMDLFFEGVQVERGGTRYAVGGKVALGDVEAIDLTALISRGDMAEFIPVFGRLTSGLWWFPSSLAGEMRGEVRVHGGLGLDALVVDGTIDGTGWDYLGERVSQVSLRGGYDRGRYYVSSFRAVKRNGVLEGAISYGADRHFDWSFKTENLELSEIDYIARLDVPVRGRLSVLSTGRGREGSVESSSVLALSDFAVRGVGSAPSELALKTSGGVASVKGVAFGGQGSFEMTYGFSAGSQSYLKIDARSLDFTPVLLLISPELIRDRALSGYVAGALELSFKSGEVEKGSGKLEVLDYQLIKTGARFALASPVDVRIEKGSFDLADLAIQGNRGKALLTLRSRSAELQGAFSGDLDLSLVEFFTSAVSDAKAVCRLGIDIAGNLKAPRFSGAAALDGGSIRIPSVDAALENLSGAFRLRQNGVTVERLAGDLSGGHVEVEGQIHVFADRYPTLRLSGRLGGSKLKVYPFQFVTVRGKLDVHGEKPPYTVDGALTADGALTREKFTGQVSSRGSKSVRYNPPPLYQARGDLPLFRLNIGVAADRGVLVQNDLFDAELKGRVTLVNTIEAPRLLGSADVIQGKITFKDRVFAIQSATINFDNPTVLNPRFNLTAHADLTGTKVQLYGFGRPDSYRIELSSTPVLPEAEILSLLALGITSDEVKRLRATDRSAVEQSEAVSVVLHSTDFNRDLRDRTGLDIKIDESVNPQVGTSIFRPRSETEPTGSAPKIVIRRPFGKSFDLSVGSTVGVGTSSQREVNAELKVLPGLSVIGVWDSLEGVDTQNNRTSYGVDVKVQRRFK